MSTAAATTWDYPRKLRDTLLAASGLLMLLMIVTFARHVGAVQPHRDFSLWLFLHLAAILPAIPLGAVMLLRTKGDRTHRIIGRIWCGLMLVAAITSFGLQGLTGHLGPIHILSVITLVAIPRAILAARAGKILQHRRSMTIVYASLLIAGYFTLLPTRMLGRWMLG